MAVYLQDFSITSSLALWFALKERAKLTTGVAANWTVRTGSTGSVYSVAGDPISSLGQLGAGAWWVQSGHGFADSGAVHRRELCWQVNGSGQVRAKYSPRAGFTGGSPSATQVPSATDERVFLGGGTDASPTYVTLWPSSGAWAQARFDESTDATLIFTYPVGGGAVSSVLWLETTPLVYDGTRLVDPDPLTLHCATGATCLTDDLGSDLTAPRGLLSMGDSDELWARLPVGFRMNKDSGGTWRRIFPGGLPQDPAYPTAVYSQESARFGRGAYAAGTLGTGEAGNCNTCGDKGKGTVCRLSGTAFASPTALDGREASTGSATTRTLLGLGYLVYPWGGYQPAI